MAQPITFNIVQDPAWLADDRLQFEIAGVIQRDRFMPWGQERLSNGFGRGRPDLGLFGAWVIQPDRALFGAGFFGAGAGGVEILTIGRFVAGDYTVRARAIDALGNIGDWSEPVTIEHRPQPPAPTNLAAAGTTLTWAWSDP